MVLFDLHTHILPGVDDGAKNLETSLEMIRFATEHGTRAIALTPHVVAEDRESFLRQVENNRRVFDLLSDAAKELPVALYLGGEVHVSPFLMDNLFHLPLPTLNKSRYVLTEFPYYFPETGYGHVLYDLLSAGYIPLIAHPERYDAVQRKPELAAEWVRMGCRLQLTAASITGSFGRSIKKLSEQLLKQDLVSCIASDAHDTRYRTPDLLPAYRRLSTLLSPDRADFLMGGGGAARLILTDSAL